LEALGYFVASEWHARSLGAEAEGGIEADVRQARADDVDAMADLAERKRQQYAAYAPRFWRPAPDGREKHLPFLGVQLTRDDTVALVADAADPDAAYSLDGFLIARDGGVDDFAVAAPEMWPTVGAALLRTAERESAARGVGRMVLVCGAKDAAKAEMLRAAGYAVVERWYVNERPGGWGGDALETETT
jgi:hypothetical protein